MATQTHSNGKIQVANTAQAAPNDAAAEEATLGSILINPDVAGIIFSILAEADFWSIKNQWVYGAMKRLSDAGAAIDGLTVALQVKLDGHTAADFGGSIEAYMTALSSATPTHIHAETYARFIRKLAARRKLLALASDIAQAALDGSLTFDEALEKSERRLADIAEYGAPVRFEHISESLNRVEAMIAEQLNAGDRYVIPAISTGFKTIDRHLFANGFIRSDLVVVAGLRASGKTSFMMQMALSAAHAGLCAAVLSLEMQTDAIALRMVASESHINAKNFVNGLVRKREYVSFIKVQNDLSTTRLWLTHDMDASNVNRLEHLLKRLRDLNNGCLDIIFIDYAQIMSTGEDNDRRNQQIALITRELKRIAGRMNITVVVGSQLTRSYAELVRAKAGEDTPVWPEPQHLAESSSLENDADLVLAIVHHKGKSSKKRAYVYCLKQRNGESEWPEELEWTPGLTSFAEKEDITQKPLNLG